MAVQYKRGNRYSPHTTLADAAVDWQGLPPDQQELVVIDNNGLPYLAGVPELTERAEAILEAAHSRHIAGRTFDEDGYPLRPSAMKLERESVATWINATNRRLATPTPIVVAPVQVQDRLLLTNEVTKIIGCSRSTLHRLMDRGTFPRPTHPGTNNKWLLSVINAYLAAQPSTISPAPEIAEDDI